MFNNQATPFSYPNAGLPLSPELEKRMREDVEKYCKKNDLPRVEPKPTISAPLVPELLPKMRQEIEYTELQLSKMLDKDTLFRFAYVPFVIAELVWDYTDTILIMASQMRLTPTKKLCRVIKQLRVEYDRYRSGFIDDAHHQSEEENMLVFEDGVNGIFSTFLIHLKSDIQREHPDLSSDSVSFLMGVYQAHITLRALFLYVENQKKKIEGIVKKTIGDILPKHVRALDTAILAFVGDSPASKGFEKIGDTYVRTLANQMALIELNDLPTDNQ